MKRAVITGASGVVGMALIHKLVAQGIEVLVLCHKGSERNCRIPQHCLVKVKYCDLDQLAAFQNESGKSYDVFYHLAWEGTTGVARDDMFLQNRNVRYSLDAVGAAKRLGCHKFIGIGSQAEYGRVESLLAPDTPANPETGYGIGKLCAGQMTREYAHQLSMEHVWVRILSVYGPFDRGDSLVMSIMGSLYHGENPKCTKGEQEWDYLYSEDAAKAIWLLGDYGRDSHVYVLGSGRAYPLSYYIEEICEMVRPGSRPMLGALPYPPRQVMYLCADISALNKDTGFAPEITFQEGVRRTARWFEENYL